MFNPTQRNGLIAAAALAALVTSFTPAAAVSERVRSACTSDYLKFCSQYDPESFQTNNCMKRNGSRLSKTCQRVVREEGLGGGGNRAASRQR
jgi:hypothetical protein